MSKNRFKEAATLFEKFVKENGHEPRYAWCAIRFLDDNSKSSATFKLYESEDELDETDDYIFYYCRGLSDLLDLMTESEWEDFVIEEVLEYSDKL